MMYFLFSIIIICYITMLIISVYGLQKKRNIFKIDTPTKFCSIVLSARNESESIIQTLNTLCSQEYPKNLFEIIIANDHSTDNTLDKIKNFSSPSCIIKCIDLPEEITGKKQALQHILPFTKGDYIFFTDADCLVPKNWLLNYIEYIQSNPGSFYFGSVSHKQEKNILQKCFTLDFLGMVAIQAGMANMNFAFSCNAANMCITREFYLNSYSTNTKFESGDDVFLLHQAKKLGNNNVHFIQDINNSVLTNSPENISSFIKQRIRWSSKTKGYSDNAAIIIAFAVFAMSFTIFSTACFSLYSSYFIEILVTLFIIKALADLLFFTFVLPKFDKQRLLWLVIPFEFLYVFYITIIPIFALIVPLSWKDRKIK